MEALEHDVLPRLIEENRQARRLRVWSAACSTGEEPLSLAMLLHAHHPRLAHWEIQILATDLRTRALEGARRGLYRDWSFRECPQRFKDRYFKRQPDGQYLVDSKIRAMVQYEKFNLAQEALPWQLAPAAAFDLILCRNVLIYFAPESITELLRRFYDSLREGGWLIVSAAEAQAIIHEGFDHVRIGGAFFFQKKSALDRVKAAPMDLCPAPGLTTMHPHTFRRKSSRVPVAEPDCLPRNSKAGGTVPPVPAPELSRILRDAARHLETANLVEARIALKQALFLDRNNPTAQLFQGQLHQLEGQRAKARRCYSTALKLLEAHDDGDVIDEEQKLTAGELIRLLRESLDGARQ
jgi:chemotaxis protein methyltransferase CheR